jgi:Dolichyl-phosphate-mannose-protein mannosyltransferase
MTGIKTGTGVSGFFGKGWPLLLALGLALSLSLIGISWGRYEDWNFDQMAFLPLKADGFPVHYLKPPLHTYLTQFLVIRPLHALAAWIPSFTDHREGIVRLTVLGGHLLTILLYCGSIALVYLMVLRSSGRKPAAFVSLILATSAGLLQFNHYGTADSPLLFWMLASLAMAMKYAFSGRWEESIAAGLLAGLAAADKYNGLGVAVAIPAAAMIRRGWLGVFLPSSLLGALAVPAGFLIGNPGAVLDRERFVQQFLYNSLTTPVYYGDAHRTGYWDFLMSFPELLGMPASLLLAILFAVTLRLFAKGGLDAGERHLVCVTSAVFLFYFVTIGRFPRMEPRFVLPAIPFALMLVAPAVRRTPLSPGMLGIFGAILAYNILCSAWLGFLFRQDPRMDAQTFASSRFFPGASVESTYAPDWNLLPGVSVSIRRVACDSGADNRFTAIFGKENAIISKGLRECAAHDPSGFFSAEELGRRNPDFITFTSVTYVIAADEGTRAFYRDLENGRLGYSKIFEKSLPKTPGWLYPRSSDALMDRMVILARTGDRSSTR